MQYNTMQTIQTHVPITVCLHLRSQRGRLLEELQNDVGPAARIVMRRSLSPPFAVGTRPHAPTTRHDMTRHDTTQKHSTTIPASRAARIVSCRAANELFFVGVIVAIDSVPQCNATQRNAKFVRSRAPVCAERVIHPTMIYGVRIPYR
uniref:Uncharacterized protein n=1 Tax=Pseudo-nitzschia australis TaxID=44445 RepID=A0A7S4ENT1_9STRA|mmetsp:Transcript_26169/g.54845  ORF Transcript_26169/g.54845 Transcript_26169/m.54845 type:complete len:148 (-) Transcript_26169:168-611(-)